MNNISTGFSHSFDTGVAQMLGLNAAAVYNHILYWLRHNFADGINFEEGKTWTYNSFEKMTKYMPYLTKDQIRRSLEDLFEAGLIIKSNFNSSKFDRTSWYSVPDQSIIDGSKNDYDKANLPHGRGEFAKSKRRNCHISNTRENTREEHKEQQQPAAPAAAFQAHEKKQQHHQEPTEIHPALQPLEIPIADKVEITQKYAPDKISDAVAWAQHPTTVLNKGLSPAIKWACQNSIAPPEDPQKGKKNADETFALNNSYYRQINKIAFENGIRLENYGLRVGMTDYLETENSKIYYKDVSFLEQIYSFLRKKSVGCLVVFDAIRSCQTHFQAHR